MSELTYGNLFLNFNYPEFKSIWHHGNCQVQSDPFVHSRDILKHISNLMKTPKKLIFPWKTFAKESTFYTRVNRQPDASSFLADLHNHPFSIETLDEKVLHLKYSQHPREKKKGDK